MATPLRLVAGLGNIGRDYERTRHNAGFWFADALAAQLGAAFAHEGRFDGAVARTSSGLRIVKPATYMNVSGRSVAPLARFYALAPSDILVVHDELDLPPGEARLKRGGGVAGHNGLRDIKAQLGSDDFWRLRLGIGHPRDSEFPQQPVADYVLKPPRPDERTAIEAAIARTLDLWRTIESGDFDRAMLVLHTRPAASPAGAPQDMKR